MSYTPLGNRVLVRQLGKSERVGSGILFAPQGSEEWPAEGVIEAVGPKFYHAYLAEERPRVGDRVHFKRRPGSALIQDDREPGERASDRANLLMLEEDDILMVVDVNIKENA